MNTTNKVYNTINDLMILGALKFGILAFLVTTFIMWILYGFEHLLFLD
jgi:hypothetical protein